MCVREREREGEKGDRSKAMVQIIRVLCDVLAIGVTFKDLVI